MKTPRANKAARKRQTLPFTVVTVFETVKFEKKMTQKHQRIVRPKKSYNHYLSLR